MPTRNPSPAGDHRSLGDYPSGGSHPTADDRLPEDLLAEAAAGLQSDIDADVLAEAAEILNSERVGLRLVDRLAGAPSAVAVTLRSGCRIEGRVQGVGDRVVVLSDEQGVEHCIAVGAVVTVRDLPPALASASQATRAQPHDAPQPPQKRVDAVTWGRFLRGQPALAVRLVLLDGSSHTGLAALVGADHVDLLLADGVILTCALGSVSRAVRVAPLRT